jgi:Putative restriction endonuclease
MDTQSLAAAVLDPLAVPADRLYRVSPALYRGLVEHGLVDPRAVALADGLLVREAARGDGTEVDPLDRLYRMSLGAYDKVAAIGLLGPGDKVELIDGLLVTKMTKGDPHRVATHLTMDALAAVAPRGWFVSKEDPVALPTGPSGYASEPEPDVTLVRGTIRDYVRRKPDPEDLALVVEVAESSLREDRAKLARYAWQRIAVAWVVNLADRVVEVYTDPTGPVAPAGYRAVATHGVGDTVAVVIAGREVGRVAVADLLP